MESGPPVIFSYQLNGCMFPNSKPNAEERVQHVTATLIQENGEKRVLFAVEDRTEASARIKASRAELDLRKETELALRAALEEKGVLMRELNHRVKNNLNLILSLISLQRDGVDTEKYRAGLDDLEGRIRSFSLLHETLYQQESSDRVRLDHYVGSIASELFQSMRRPDSDTILDFDAAPLWAPIKPALHIGLIAVEAITNAMKYAVGKNAGKCIRLRLRPLGSSGIELEVADDGPGFKEGYDPLAGDSLGLKLVAILVAELGGELSFESGAGIRLLARFNSGIVSN